jgi:hypothetical protein
LERKVGDEEVVDDDEYMTREQTILKNYEDKSNQKVLLDGQNLVQ